MYIYGYVDIKSLKIQTDRLHTKLITVAASGEEERGKGTSTTSSLLRMFCFI